MRVGRPIADPFVAVHESYLGDSGRSLRALLDAGADGLVVAGFGAGHVPASMVPVLQEAADRMPVIVASRTGHGGTLTRTYGFAGSEVDLLARGIQLAGVLDHRKARLLTWALLASGVPYPAEFAALFEEACPTYD
jgi:L-asparaginase